MVHTINNLIFFERVLQINLFDDDLSNTNFINNKHLELRRGPEAWTQPIRGDG
jgi:hypothetical protein